MRFWDRVEQTWGGCWEWRGCRDARGYGRVAFRGKSERTHRVAAILAGLPVESGPCVLHTCDNPPCCNPAHLFVGTKGDNNRDRHAKGRDGGWRIKGARNGRAKLTAEQVAQIRSRCAAGETQARVAREYGIIQPHVSRIVRGDAW